MSEDKEIKFAVMAESSEFSSTLMMHNLSFGRLIDDVVLPYQTTCAFFIDGVPVKPERLRRIKIGKQTSSFEGFLADFHWKIRHFGNDISKSRVLADQYHIRLEALFRENTEDVTSQVIKAFDEKIKPSLKDYLPKREELIGGAYNLFLASIQVLAKSYGG